MIEPAGFFDTDCDIAALVYAPSEDPDAMLLSFTGDLAACGVDIAGLLQRRSDATSAVEFALMPDAFRAMACGNALPQAAAALRAAIEQGPDLLVINRFGSAELSGGGLLGVLIEAAGRDIPVLIAVPAALFPGWLAFTGGVAVRLACRRAGLERWWRSLAPAQSFRLPAETACERFK
jgi:hypothetical protein